MGQLIEDLKIKIVLIKEYQQSLISEAVTGKIDVRREVEIKPTENITTSINIKNHVKM